MKTYTTSQSQEFTIDYASSLPSGHGHRKITVSVIAENGDKKDFSSITSNMHSYDEANDLEGQEKYEALFEIIENDLDGKLTEWISSIED